MQSPYTPGTDVGMLYSNFGAQFALSTAIIDPAHGGTGVNNGANTATFAGNLNFANSFTTSGNFAVTQTYTGITNVTFPTSGTLATTAQLPTFPITLAQGGTNASLVASNGGIFYSTATAGAILSGQLLPQDRCCNLDQLRPLPGQPQPGPLPQQLMRYYFHQLHHQYGVSEVLSAASATLVIAERGSLCLHFHRPYSTKLYKVISRN